MTYLRWSLRPANVRSRFPKRAHAKSWNSRIQPILLCRWSVEIVDRRCKPCHDTMIGMLCWVRVSIRLLNWWWRSVWLEYPPHDKPKHPETKKQTNDKLSMSGRNEYSIYWVLAHIDTISVASIKRIVREQCFNVTQTCDFELFGLLFDHFTMECWYQWSWIQQQWTIGQLHIALLNRSQIITRCLRHWIRRWWLNEMKMTNCLSTSYPWLANGSCRQI